MWHLSPEGHWHVEGDWHTEGIFVFPFKSLMLVQLPNHHSGTDPGPWCSCVGAPGWAHRDRDSRH